MAGIGVTLRCSGVSVDPGLATREAVTIMNPVVTRYCTGTISQATVDCPVDTGMLRAGHRMVVRASTSRILGEIRNDVTYAAAVHGGRRPVVIRPVRRRVLRFTVGGRVVYARYVRQPGRSGRPWLADAGRSVARRDGYRWSDG